MTKRPETTPSTEALVPKLVQLPPDLKNDVLIDAVAVYNGLYADQTLVKLFPTGLSMVVVYEDLLAAVKIELAWRAATATVSDAVLVKAGTLKDAKRMYVRMLKMIDGDFPNGTPGRGDFFPQTPGENSVGTLLVATAHGAEKHGMALPEGWTPASIRAMGEQAQQAEAVRDGGGKTRKDVSTLRTNRLPRTREIRKRLRDKIVGFFGLDSPRLPEFGIAVRPVRIPRRRSSKDVPQAFAAVD
jgi:hypothetical protein